MTMGTLMVWSRRSSAKSALNQRLIRDDRSVATPFLFAVTPRLPVTFLRGRQVLERMFTGVAVKCCNFASKCCGLRR